MDDDIDKEMLTPVDEVPPVQPPVPKKKLVKRIQPTVEGINAPKTTRSTVVVRTAAADERERAGADFKPIGTRLIPDRVIKPRHHIGRWVTIFIILAILIGAAYEGYAWYLNKHILPVPSYNMQTWSSGNSSSSSSSELSLYNPATTSTSTLITTPGGATSTPASTTPPAAPATQLTVNQTPTGYLNVRSAPSTSGTLITQVHPGETYVYTSTQNGWYEILLPSGTSGWVTGQYVTVQK
jgi:hypothetical protein